MQWEYEVLNFIQRYLQSDTADFLMKIFTGLGEGGFIWITAGVILCCTKRYRIMGISVLLALLIMQIAGNMCIKPLAGRLRPFYRYPDMVLRIPAPDGFSFPSGHTYSSFAAAAAIASYDRRMGQGAIFLAILIAFSRLYFFVHFPTDVLAGILLGILTGKSASALITGWTQRMEKSSKV